MIAVDLFAGGGGASLGMELAGATVEHAVNHWPVAINVHARNHRKTTHHLESVWRVRPVEMPPDVLWASPDCTHFSRAKGGKPRKQGIRSLAWSVVRWAAHAQPRVIIVENVPEFAQWGPLHTTHSNGCAGDTGRPCPLILSTGRGRFNAAMPESEFNPVEDWTSIGPKGGCHYGTPDEKRKGQTFRAWARKLERLGYHVERRVLAACDYGAPTTRRRLYVIARRDGAPSWPTPTHGPGCAQPWRTAAEVIDWSLPMPSIFERKKPLAEATLARIARGIKRFVLDEQRPFLIHVSNGERVGQVPRIYDLQRPLGTVVAGGVKQALVACYLARHFGGRGTVGSSMAEPLRTVTAQDHHALVAAFLTRYQGTSTGNRLGAPLPTVTGGGEHFGLTGVCLDRSVIVDIGMRLLTPRELARAQGFPDDYVIDHGADGKRITRTDQVRLIGNSVCPPVARAIVEANR